MEFAKFGHDLAPGPSYMDTLKLVAKFCIEFLGCVEEGGVCVGGGCLICVFKLSPNGVHTLPRLVGCKLKVVACEHSAD